MPELLSLICSFLNKQDCAACLCISRFTFTIVASIIWEDTDLKPVLSLIPGMQVTTDERWEDPYLIFQFPATPDLTRFEIYRPLVKAINTTVPYAITFPEQWPSASVPASSQPLLPNLQSITINTYGWVDDPYVEWIPRFLTPGLKKFKMRSVHLKKSFGDVGAHDNAWINPSRCIEIVDAMSRTCPNIETLEIFANEKYGRDRAEYVAICEKVAGLVSLRSLSFGGATASNTLFQAFEAATDDSSALLSDDSFPALKYLTLCGLQSDVIVRVYDSPQLFNCLISAKIVYGDYENYDEGDYFDLRSAYAMRCFSHGCSLLTDLTIVTQGAEGDFYVFRRFISIFKQLPLRRLRLCGVELNPESSYYAEEEDLHENDPEVTWEELFAALPHLEELDLYNHFSTDELVVLASLLPKLCYFSPASIWQAKITLKYAPGTTAKSTTTQLIIICCDYPQYRYADDPARHMFDVAR
ncbi:hypothetical protein FRC12_014678 [Ceratobasidium sp. 428]|nr:hypothetical protein FRC12_014678 [Ceratobasidium sp. 428]